MTLFVGPVASTGGPAIKNSTTIKHLFPSGSVKIINTYKRDIWSRATSILRTAVSCEKQAIIAVSRKGRAALWPIAYRKAKLDPRFRYALVCIGGTIAEEAKDNRRYIEYMNNAAVVTVETNGVADELEKLGVISPHVMTNFVDNLLAKRPAVHPNRRGPLRFVYLSSVRNKKGIETMLAAFRSALSSGLTASLDIYGPIKTDFNPALLEGIGKDEPIAYKGVVPSEDVVSVLAGYDCFIFPSEYETEGFPAVLAEAMAAGLPILASDVSYNPEIVCNGNNGWVYRSGDASALADLLCQCEKRRGELDEMARNNFEECLRYDAGRVVGKLRNALLAQGWVL